MDHRAVGIGPHYNILELRNLLQTPQGVELVLEGLTGRSRCLADRTGCHLLVLLLNSVAYIAAGKAQVCQARRIKPDPHGIFAQSEIVHLGHPRNPRQGVGEVNISIVL